MDIIDDIGVVIDSDQTQETEYVFYPRAINTTYYARVRALDIAGNIGGYSPLSDGVDIVLQKSIIREYDVNGNMIVVKKDVGGQVETLSVLTYDASDKLKTYTEDSLVTTMVYDGDGRRVRKTLEDTASFTVESDISYLYDGRRILYEVDETGLEPSLIASYVYGINLIARLEGISGSTAYYFYNGHGDVTGLVDIDSVLIGSFDYEAFGDILEETGVGETPFKFAGEYLDRETGLYLMGARYYASEMGRWITEDPYKGSVGDPLSLNLYVFVRNSPLIYVDPSGFAAADWDQLYYGMENHRYVQELKQILSDMGFLPYTKANEMTREFDELTRDAVKAFQEEILYSPQLQQLYNQILKLEIPDIQGTSIADLNINTKGIVDKDTRKLFEVYEIMVFAQTIYGEARGQNETARTGVGWVIKNRVDHGRTQDFNGHFGFILVGGNYVGVAKAPAQFSPWTPGTENNEDMINAPMSNSREWQEILSIAKELYYTRGKPSGKFAILQEVYYFWSPQSMVSKDERPFWAPDPLQDILFDDVESSEFTFYKIKD